MFIQLEDKAFLEWQIFLLKPCIILVYDEFSCSKAVPKWHLEV